MAGGLLTHQTLSNVVQLAGNDLKQLLSRSAVPITLIGHATKQRFDVSRHDTEPRVVLSKVPQHRKSIRIAA